jgi:hypothetical protein
MRFAYCTVLARVNASLKGAKSPTLPSPKSGREKHHGAAAFARVGNFTPS